MACFGRLCIESRMLDKNAFLWLSLWTQILIAVKCLENCCSESSPPRYPPIRVGDYLEVHLRLSYSSKE
ncbi:hypothetical protein H6P81_005167 [Aristolochia fimbriata]|uniref:Uncharacterized protein n=1 Tax=Aristolochia fimbriata TaxID=158543 RepID=A0AAV7EU81_ARIFI|nr:hypothetical protein H6P81_005167 [Aristolochia fimbriata]